MLDPGTLDKLKALARNEDAYYELVKLIETERRLRREKQFHLELLESAIRNDYDAILITELNLDKPGPRIVYVNDGFLKMTGYSRDEVLGKTPRILQGPKTDRKVLERLKKYLSQGRAFFGQTVNYRKDGSEFLNQWDIHPLPDRDGNITHWVSYQHDVTDRKRAEQRLINSNIDLNDAYEETKKIYVDLNTEGAVTGSNAAFRELLGYDRDEITNYKIWDLAPQKFTEPLRNEFSSDRWRSEFSDGSTMSLVLQKKNGLSIQTEIKTRILELKEGGRIIRCDISNVSLRENVLKALKRHNSEYNKIFERKADFRYGLVFNKSGEPEYAWLSDGFYRMTGYRPDEIQGEGGWKKLIHKEDHKAAMTHLDSVSKGKSSCEKIRIVHKDGSVRTIMDYVKVDENDSNGRLKGSAIEVAEDISSPA